LTNDGEPFYLDLTRTKFWAESLSDEEHDYIREWEANLSPRTGKPLPEEEPEETEDEDRDDTEEEGDGSEEEEDDHSDSHDEDSWMSDLQQQKMRILGDILANNFNNYEGQTTYTYGGLNEGFILYMRGSGEDSAYTDAVVSLLGRVDYEDLFDYNYDGVIERDDVLDFVANVAGW